MQEKDVKLLVVANRVAICIAELNVVNPRFASSSQKSFAFIIYHIDHILDIFGVLHPDLEKLL